MKNDNLTFALRTYSDKYFFFHFVVETVDLTINVKSVKDILVHRTNVMKDLIKEFKDKEILNYNLNVRVIASNGALEKGEGIGVTREILSLFWQSFFTSLAVGAKEKVPSIRHDFQKKLLVSHCTGFVVWVH